MLGAALSRAKREIPRVSKSVCTVKGPSKSNWFLEPAGFTWGKGGIHGSPGKDRLAATSL